MSTVATMVSEPPSSTLRAAPMKRRGGVDRGGIEAAGERAPAGRDGQIVGAGEPGDAVEQHHDIFAALHQPLGALEAHLGDVRRAPQASSKVEL